MRKGVYFLVAFVVIFFISGCKSGGGGSGSVQSVESSGPETAGIEGDLGDGYLLEDDLGTDVDDVSDTPVVDEDDDTDVDGGIDLVDLPDDDEPDYSNPEPSTLLMFGISLLGLAGYKIRKSRS